jgi:hypothetical protein
MTLPILEGDNAILAYPRIITFCDLFKSNSPSQSIRLDFCF